MIKQGDITYIKFTRILRIAQDLMVAEARKVQADFKRTDDLPIEKDLSNLVDKVIEFFSYAAARRKIEYSYMDQIERRGVSIPTYHIWIRDQKGGLLAEVDCQAYKRVEIKFFNPNDDNIPTRLRAVLTKDPVTRKGSITYFSLYGDGCDLVEYMDSMAWPTDAETCHENIYRRVSVSALIKERYDEPSLSPAYRVRLDEKEFIDNFLVEAKDYYSDYVERN